MASVLLLLLDQPLIAVAHAQRFRDKIARDFLAGQRVPAILEITAEVLARGRRRS
jgi:hypothetical protein